MIVFSMYDNNNNQCSDHPVGTYITPVPDFVLGYLDILQQEAQDQGQDYQYPKTSQFVSCTPLKIQNQYFYFQVGCSDTNSQQLAINIYEDNTCTKRSTVEGMDDSNIDASALAIPFDECHHCVNWVNGNDGVDDMFYKNRQMHAPWCEAAWAYKSTCDKTCQHMGAGASDSGKWSTPDKIILAILGAFGLVMLILIARKRRSMSNKDALLEQAAMSAAGLQTPHVIFVFVLVVLVVAVFALLGLKNITWTFLLLINTILFGYMMKLTVDSGLKGEDTMVGPDGNLIRKDSDDSSVDDTTRAGEGGSSTGVTQNNAGAYVIPTLA
jgi:hypothetical protein